MKKGAWVAFAALLLVVVGSALALWSVQHRQGSLPQVAAVTVPDSWRSVREGYLHVAHVQRERLACDDCHDPSTFASPPRSRCEACHEERAAVVHGRPSSSVAAPSEASECIACHRFGPHHEATRWDCLACHAHRQGDLPETRIHTEEACARCHQPHEDARGPAAVQCQTCHDLGGAALGHGACTDCHSAHGVASTAHDRCGGCHAKDRATFAGHDSCSTCHAAHSYGEQSASCDGCHAGVHTLASERVGAHRKCDSCHDPHNVAHVPERTCRRCHDHTTDHPKTSSGTTCLGCHPVHAARSGRARAGLPYSAAALACTTCHDGLGASRDDGLHGGKAVCTECHRPHAFVATAGQARACEDCHRERSAIVAGVRGHGDCAACHTGHAHALGSRPFGPSHSAPDARACTGCHEGVHVDEGHGDCLACHDAHTAQPGKRSCAACHAEQHRRARTGHDRCGNCHMPHGAGRATPPCLTCHSRMREAPHGGDNDCRACHDPHGDAGQGADPPGVPACVSCHGDPLPGLHGVAEHGQCTTCHVRSHRRGGEGDRRTCLSCHRQQTHHEPEADTCHGCHLFRL
ncbi:MAG: hypothetical protein OXU20_14775 [Myxococcales bacterium]|nr:hypothetical protein [Myxococcales bacterium]